MKRLVLALAIVLLVPTQALAQQSPELQALYVLVGEWTYDDLSGGGTCEWVGRSFVVCLMRWTTAAGNANAATWVSGYDAENEVYTSSRFYDNGYSDSGTGWRDGDTWTYVYDSTAGTKLRMTQVYDSETSGTYQWARSAEGESSQIG